MQSTSKELIDLTQNWTNEVWQNTEDHQTLRDIDLKNYGEVPKDAISEGDNCWYEHIKNKRMKRNDEKEYYIRCTVSIYVKR